MKHVLTAAVALALGLSVLHIGGPTPSVQADQADQADWHDFNGDGFADLAVGAPFDDVGADREAGVVHVLYGSANGLRAAGDRVWHQDRVPGLGGQGAEPFDHFGFALAVGDFNGDGFGDLAIGVPDENVKDTTDLGMVQVLFGSDAGLRAAGAQAFARGDTPGNQFGFAMVGLDRFAGPGQNGVDRFTDLAVGSPGSIRVTILPASEDGIDLARHSALVACGTVGGRCGASLAAGDIDGDGEDDLIAGAPNQTVDGKQGAGLVRLALTQGSGDSVDLTEDEVANSAAQAGAHFGASLAVGDVNGDGFPDTVVGAPDRDVRVGGVTVRNAGHFVELHGRDGPPNLAAAFSQASDGIPDAPESGDRFGASFAIGNLGGDGDLDLAIGAPGERVGSVVAGKVFLFFGDSTQVWHQNVSGVLGTSIARDRFGASLAAADFGRSTRADLAIGVPLANVPGVVDAGEVAVAYGSPNGLTARNDQLWQQDSPGIGESAEDDDQMGFSLR